MNRFLKLLFSALCAVATAWTVTAAGKPGSDTATGIAFLPNPVADLQDQSLTDQKDTDYAALAPAYHRVTRRAYFRSRGRATCHADSVLAKASSTRGKW